MTWPMFWNKQNESIPAYCISKEALWLSVSQAADTSNYHACVNPSIAYFLHPLGTCLPLDSLPALLLIYI